MRSHQLKMGKKVTEERRRRRRTEGCEEGIQCRKPTGEQARSRPSSQGSGEHIEKEGEEGLETVGLARGEERRWSRIGLGQPGVLLEPTGAESVYLVSH